MRHAKPTEVRDDDQRPHLLQHLIALRPWRLFLVALAFPARPIYAQSSPWENAVPVMQTAFTGTIAKGLSLVAIVVGGLMFAFGEGDSKRMLAGIVFGVGMAIGAVAFMTWLFGG